MRQAHEIAGRLVRTCEERECRLAELTRDDFTGAHPSIGDDVRSFLGVENAVAPFRSLGSTGPAQVELQLKTWQERLASN